MNLVKRVTLFIAIITILVGCAKSPSSNSVIENVTEKSNVEESGNLETQTTVEETTSKEETISKESTSETTTKESTTETTSKEITEDTAAKESTTQETTKEIVTEETTKNNKKKRKGLSVQGTNLVDSSGKIVTLRGVSTHGLSWFPQYVNKDAFKCMRDEWNVNTIRLAMYTAEYNGYCVGDENNRQALIELVDNGVNYATELGMYVIIDWHILSDNNPNIYKNQSIEFFDKVSKKYSKNTNVIYEICNEPNGDTSWEEIKSYAVDVIDTIRKNDRDAVIIVGTPTWSQCVDQTAASPIDRENIMYALHFYADTHRDDLRNKMVNAINSGLPVIVSEFGICDASGNGNVNIEEANKWMQVIKQHKVSYVIWNLSNKQESSALINSSCNKVSGWTKDDLSESGKWFVLK